MPRHSARQPASSQAVKRIPPSQIGAGPGLKLLPIRKPMASAACFALPTDQPAFLPPRAKNVPLCSWVSHHGVFTPGVNHFDADRTKPTCSRPYASGAPITGMRSRRSCKIENTQRRWLSQRSDPQSL